MSKAPPIAAAPPPFPTDDKYAGPKIAAVGIFGSIVTASVVALLLLIVLCGAGYAAMMGCLGACAKALNNGQAPPPADNPLGGFIAPLIAGLVSMWVILTTVVFVIQKRRRR